MPVNPEFKRPGRKPEAQHKAPVQVQPAAAEDPELPETPEVKAEEPKAREEALEHPAPAPRISGQELIDKLRQERRVKRLEEKGY